MTYSKQNQKKGTMRKEKPKKPNTKTICFNFFATKTEQQTTHTSTHSLTQTNSYQSNKKAACENWQRCSASASATARNALRNLATEHLLNGLILSDLKLQTGN